MKKNRIFFRADGNNKIGLGHVVRSLSLTEIIQSEFECFFLIRNPEEAIRRLIKQFCPLIELESRVEDEFIELSSIVNETDILVLDGYNFNSAYQQEIRSKIKKLVMIDDKADHHYYADLIINQGDASVIKKYSAEPYTRILAGLSYAIMRNEFLASAKIERKILKVDTVFICMGGSDPFNITVKAVLACLKTDFIERIIIVTGSAYRNRVQLENVLNSNDHGKAILQEENVGARRLVELIKMSEIAIAPASSIALEICCVKAGLLSGIVIDNQEESHRQLTELGCCISIGSFNDVSVLDIVNHLQKLRLPSIVNEIMREQSKAIDGLSGKRLLEEFKQLTTC